MQPRIEYFLKTVESLPRVIQVRDHASIEHGPHRSLDIALVAEGEKTKNNLSIDHSPVQRIVSQLSADTPLAIDVVLIGRNSPDFCELASFRELNKEFVETA